MLFGNISMRIATMCGEEREYSSSENRKETNMPVADQIKLKNVRLSFPDLWEAKSVKGSEPKYGASFLLSKEDDAAQIDALKKTIWAVAKEKFGAKAADLIKSGKVRICLHDGSEKEYEGYGEGVMYVTATSKKRPVVVDRDRTPLTKDDQRPYAGAYVNVVLRLWAQQNNFGQRINAQLQGVQFAEDGEAFGAAPFDPNEAFEELEPSKEQAQGGGDGDDEDSIPF